MGIIIFWSVIALSYLALAIYTGKARKTFKKKLRKLEKVSPGGFVNEGKYIGIDEELYKAIKAILVTSIIGCLIAAVAATGSFIIIT